MRHRFLKDDLESLAMRKLWKALFYALWLTDLAPATARSVLGEHVCVRGPRGSAIDASKKRERERKMEGLAADRRSTFLFFFVSRRFRRMSFSSGRGPLSLFLARFVGSNRASLLPQTGQVQHELCVSIGGLVESFGDVAAAARWLEAFAQMVIAEWGGKTDGVDRKTASRLSCEIVYRRVRSRSRLAEDAQASTSTVSTSTT